MKIERVELLRDIASSVRKRCVRFAMSAASRKFDFHNHSALDCMCAVASHALYLAFSKRGIRSKIVFGYLDDDSGCSNDHCWVETGKHVVDITATQFGDSFADVWVFEKRKKSQQGYSKGRVVNYHQLQWERQNPTPKTSRKILSIPS